MAKSVVINGVTYSAVPSVDIPLSEGGGSATFYETSPDTAAAADVLSGKTAHAAAGPVTGSMTNNGAVAGTISTKAGTYTVPAGYHSGSGSVAIASTEQAKIITANIKSGVTILGVAGSSSVVDTSGGDATAAQILSGKKAYVAGALVTGTLTAASVSQDSTSKVLSIS
jgi:hypothetical protein